MAVFPSFYNKDTKVWRGGKAQLFYDYDCSIGRVIFNSMKGYPKNICQISDPENTTLTNSEAITMAIRIAQHLKKMGLRHDNVVGIAAKNTTYLMPVGVSCLLNCTPFHAVNPVLDETTLTHLFGLTKPKIIFCDGEVYDKIYRATRTLKPLIYILSDHIDGVPKVQDLLEPTKTELFYKPETLLQGGDQTVAILCSSGTTGMPKAVCISNHTLFLPADFITSEDVMYTSSALDWISGLYVMVCSCNLGCTRIITNKPYSPEYFVELVKKYKITYAIAAPRHVATLIKSPKATNANMSSIRLLGIGGGCIALATLNALQTILKTAIINFGYALTEVGGVSINFDGEKASSVGKVMFGIQVRIVDDNGKNLGPTEVGEIYVHHGKTWNGYYSNPIETMRMQDSLGWFHTGDLGYFDTEHYLYVVDRKKEILKYHGMHYWTTEIEACIAELPDVQDVCVIGVYDESHGDEAGALVVKAKESPLSQQNIKEYVAKKLNLEHKQLNAGVLFVDKLPQNDNGKTVKREAKELFVASMGNVDR